MSEATRSSPGTYFPFVASHRPQRLDHGLKRPGGAVPYGHASTFLTLARIRA
jgi:hypothetical protein